MTLELFPLLRCFAHKIPDRSLPDALRHSLNTTNLIESVMAQLEGKTQLVDHWRTSAQEHSWCAARLLHIEDSFRRIRGKAHLLLLEVELKEQFAAITSAA